VQPAKGGRKIRLTLILRYPYNGNAEFQSSNMMVQALQKRAIVDETMLKCSVRAMPDFD
jgi:hypothetical protein